MQRMVERVGILEMICLGLFFEKPHTRTKSKNQKQTFVFLTVNHIFAKKMFFESNKLEGNLLGFYHDPVFGGSSVSFVGQMTPRDYNPTFGTNTVLDSVILTIPYSSNASTLEDVTTYELDSLYGSSPIKLSVFKNDFGAFLLFQNELTSGCHQVTIPLLGNFICL